jgi:PAS domain S-box-containing protein
MQECNPIDALSGVLMDVPDLVLAFADDGRYLFANTAAAEFLGADPFDIIGRHWQELGYSPSVMEPLMERVASVFESEMPEYYTGTSSPERGGRDHLVSLTPLRCADNSVVGVLAIIRGAGTL